MVFDNTQDVICKHGVSDSFLSSGSYSEDEITIQIPGVGSSSFPRKGIAPKTILANAYNTLGAAAFCTVTEIGTGYFKVKVSSQTTGQTYFRVHWLALWE